MGNGGDQMEENRIPEQEHPEMNDSDVTEPTTQSELEIDTPEQAAGQAPEAEDIQAENSSTEVDGKKGGDKKKKPGLPFRIVTAVFVVAFVVVLALYIQADQNLANISAGRESAEAEAKTLQEQLESTEKELESSETARENLNAQISKLKSQVSDLEDQVDSLTSENATLRSDNEELTSKNDELENGAAARLVEIKNSYEAGEWQDVVDKYNELHEKYNGSAEDEEAKALADDAQAKLEEEAQQKAEEEAKGYETGITYDQLARTPDDYIGQKVKFSGKVVQVIESSSGDETQLRIAVNNDYDTVVFAVYSSDIVSSRVLEDDQITIYGISLGTISYKSTLGGTITIPAVSVDKIDQ